MHILIGLILGCGLLYFWFVGNWFARVLVFLPLAFLLAFILIGVASDHRASQGVFFVLAIIGIALAWPLSSLPIWHWQNRMRALARAEKGIPPYQHWTQRP